MFLCCCSWALHENMRWLSHTTDLYFWGPASGLKYAGSTESKYLPLFWSSASGLPYAELTDSRHRLCFWFLRYAGLTESKILTCVSEVLFLVSGTQNWLIQDTDCVSDFWGTQDWLSQKYWPAFLRSCFWSLVRRTDWVKTLMVFQISEVRRIDWVKNTDLHFCGPVSGSGTQDRLSQNTDLKFWGPASGLWNMGLRHWPAFLRSCFWTLVHGTKTLTCISEALLLDSGTRD